MYMYAPIICFITIIITFNWYEISQVIFWTQVNYKIMPANYYGPKTAIIILTFILLIIILCIQVLSEEELLMQQLDTVRPEFNLVGTSIPVYLITQIHHCRSSIKTLVKQCKKNKK